MRKRPHPKTTTTFTTGITTIGILIGIVSVCTATRPNASLRNTECQRDGARAPSSAFTAVPPRRSFPAALPSRRLLRVDNRHARLPSPDLCHRRRSLSSPASPSPSPTMASDGTAAPAVPTTTGSGDRDRPVPKPSPTPPPSSSPSVSAALSFARLANGLKTTPRTGWILRRVPNAESVADHSWRVAVLSLLLLHSPSDDDIDEEERLDVAKCLEMAVVHDLAESIVGDIAPGDNVEPDEKKRLEEEAMASIAELLGRATSAGARPSAAEERLLSVFHEYESRRSPEAIAVKDLDLLDMILQAREYEEANPGLDLGEFFDGTPPGRFRNRRVRAVAEEVHRRRGVDVEEERRKRERDGGDERGVDGEVVATGTDEGRCGLTKEDSEFVESYVASSGLAVADAEALVRSLRKRDAELNLKDNGL